MKNIKQFVLGVIGSLVVAACGGDTTPPSNNGNDNQENGSAAQDGGATQPTRDDAGNDIVIDNRDDAGNNHAADDEDFDGGIAPTCGDCDDGVACTDDRCGDNSVCEHLTLHGRCDPGSICSAERDCVSPAVCASAADCPDLDGACLKESCNPATATCVYTPLDNDNDGHYPQICETVGGDDCDDSNPGINPEASEICDDLDNDCDGVRDQFSTECAPAISVCSASVKTCTNGTWSECFQEFEPTPEVCDTIDNDCDGVTDNVDDDGDGYFSSACGGDDCDQNDDDANIHPDEQNRCDNIDNGCALAPIDGIWCPMAPMPESNVVYGYTAVTINGEMLIWGNKGGEGGGLVQASLRYNPMTDTWSAMSKLNMDNGYAYAGREAHSAVVIGNKMIIWGGNDRDRGIGALNTGAVYEPTTNTWTEMSTTNAPEARFSHRAVAIGHKMYIWGGIDGYNPDNIQPENYVDGGGIYDLTMDTWTTMAEDYYTTGTAVIVGGKIASCCIDGHANLYDPDHDSWSQINAPSELRDISGFTTVSTGDQLIVWGGTYDFEWPPVYTNDGWLYDPINNEWQAIRPGPAGRISHAAVWINSINKMMVWGGAVLTGEEVSLYGDGRLYNPANDLWTGIPDEGAPTARFLHTMEWTGQWVVVFGGMDDNGYATTGGRYRP